MNPTAIFLLALAVFTVAILYSCVGHGGASGYIAAMTMFSLAPIILKPTALILNILVSSVAVYYFFRAGHFSWQLFWPFAAASIPCSFMGGYCNLPIHLYKPLVGVVLLFSAWRLVSRTNDERKATSPPSLVISLTAGAVIGLVSGLTGVGGGIFLSPLLVLLGWAKAREASAVAALFILVNSVSGLLGHLSGLQSVPHFWPVLASAAIVGGVIGSRLGSCRLPTVVIVRTLSVVLFVAGVKMFYV